MNDLTPRQIQILKAIIEEYIGTAEPVGSEMLDKKYNLGVSPATIRNEMVRLAQTGYLKQPHTSAGRTPTPKAMKFYVDKLMKTQELSVADEVSVKQKVWDYRSEVEKLLREATRTLASETHTLSLATTDEGDMYTAGMGHILDMPEFYDIDLTRHLLETLDEYEYWWNLVRRVDLENTLAVLMGDEMDRKYLSNCSGVFLRFETANHKGAIGVIGPSRLNYSRIIPIVRYIGGLINDFSKSW
ncbi:hypothetical protein A3D77_03745 [Candidatus Gottesmanbacteria bacterium RIFCSPHIGHO2_02_FULL_39_11]|uniref:Heat-inducible transcription repressor HrcA n=1 Tax=Candidatus Gottesmanbacteria bacterium RIFCSPHIGHO2_02_FULL_39_11 TaxID=1798382 RepID=A0A1F5ZXX4_9BACT|nr:MAG: hypothetical protein A3D77_03745 [Candidatus Gottesmanbacteria bacterium RIFCSPHIGHO2_02_FULL_39_11]